MVIAVQNEIEVEIARLRDVDLPTLRGRWRTVFRCRSPDHLSRHLLFRMLAYRLQAECLGDLDKETSQFLDRVARGGGEGGVEAAQRRGRHRLEPGSILVREWNGDRQRVSVLEEGFAWNGQTFKSLSEVAFAITGTRWSGPRFFGLRDRQRERKS